MGSTEENALEKAFEDVIEKAFPIIHNEAPIDPTRTSDTLEDPVAKALGKVAAACKAVRQHSVISTNDELDDVSTDCLRFIMLEFWRGQLLEKESDPALRLRALTGARVAYLSFLQQLQRLELLPKEEASLVGDDMIDEDDAVKHDPAQQRMYKVSRVKRARLLRDTLEHFDWRHTYLSAASGEDGIGSAEGVAGGADELRQLACDALQEAAMRAVDALGFIKQELPLLKMMAAQRGGAGAGAAAGAGGDARLSDAEARRQRERESSRDAAFAPDRPGLVSAAHRLETASSNCRRLTDMLCFPRRM